MDARGKFGEHERSLTVARGVAESNSSFLSGRKTGFVHDCRITKFSQCAVLKNKGESGFSYRFNLDVSLNYNTILQTYISFNIKRARASLSDLHT